MIIARLEIEFGVFWDQVCHCVGLGLDLRRSWLCGYKVGISTFIETGIEIRDCPNNVYWGFRHRRFQKWYQFWCPTKKPTGTPLSSSRVQSFENWITLIVQHTIRGKNDVSCFSHEIPGLWTFFKDCRNLLQSVGYNLTNFLIYVRFFGP